MSSWKCRIFVAPCWTGSNTGVIIEHRNRRKTDCDIKILLSTTLALTFHATCFINIVNYLKQYLKLIFLGDRCFTCCSSFYIGNGVKFVSVVCVLSFLFTPEVESVWVSDVICWDIVMNVETCSVHSFTLGIAFIIVINWLNIVHFENRRVYLFSV